MTVHNPRKINIVPLVINKIQCESASITLDGTVEGAMVMFQLHRMQQLNKTHPLPVLTLIENHFCLKTNANNSYIIQNNIESRVMLVFFIFS